jgi:hypothetical protein
MEAVYRNKIGRVRFTAAAALVSGEIITLPDGRTGIVTGGAGFASGDIAEALTQGEFDILSATATTFSIGDDVFWDVTNSLGVNAPVNPGDLKLGVCVKAKVSGDLDVLCQIGGPQTGESARSMVVPETVNLDWEDTASHTILAAVDNPDGMIVQDFLGIVTEAMDGGTEDQLICTLYDEDDNALSVLTPSDAGADAIGDAIVGTLTATRIALGAVLAVVPAGKAAYVKVSQATSGTSAAGAVRVSTLLKPLL